MHPPNEEEKDVFYERLQDESEKVPTHDVLCVTSDLNAKVGNGQRGMWIH